MIAQALERMTAAGVNLALDGDDLAVDSPAPLTDKQRRFLQQYKAEIIRALQLDAAQEAAEERAAILEHDAGLPRQEADRVAGLAQGYYRHLFSEGKTTGCCFAPAGRFCPEGLRLRRLYLEAAEGRPHG